MPCGAALWKTSLVITVLVAVGAIAGRNQVVGGGREWGAWTARAPIPTPRSDLAVGVANGILYAVGGRTLTTDNLSTVEAYDPTKDTWTVKAPMPTPRGGHTVGVVNSTLYAVGGDSSPGKGPSGTVEAYDPIKNTWTVKAPMVTPRGGHAVGVINGILYAVGGSTTGPSGVVEAYDPTTNTWSARAPMPTSRVSPAVGVVNGILYAVGGVCCSPGHGSHILNTVEAYDPTTNTWTEKAPVPTPRGGLAVGVVNGILYAVGGAIEGKGAVKIVEAYDPARNMWTARTPMPTGRTFLAVGVVNGILYTVGGLGTVGTPNGIGGPGFKVVLDGGTYAYKVAP